MTHSVLLFKAVLAHTVQLIEEALAKSALLCEVALVLSVLLCGGQTNHFSYWARTLVFKQFLK